MILYFYANFLRTKSVSKIQSNALAIPDLIELLVRVFGATRGDFRTKYLV